VSTRALLRHIAGTIAHVSRKYGQFSRTMNGLRWKKAEDQTTRGCEVDQVDGSLSEMYKSRVTRKAGTVREVQELKGWADFDSIQN
jgi:hypothetical protein